MVSAQGMVLFAYSYRLGRTGTPPRSQSFLSLPRALLCHQRDGRRYTWAWSNPGSCTTHYMGVGCRAGLAGEAMGEGDGVATGEIAAKTCASKRSMASELKPETYRSPSGPTIAAYG